MIHTQEVIEIKSLDIKLAHRGEYCVELILNEVGLKVDEKNPDKYHIRITPNMIMYERSLDSIHQSLSNLDFPLHATNLNEQVIKKMNQVYMTAGEKMYFD